MLGKGTAIGKYENSKPYTAQFVGVFRGFVPISGIQCLSVLYQYHAQVKYVFYDMEQSLRKIMLYMYVSVQQIIFSLNLISILQICAAERRLTFLVSPESSLVVEHSYQVDVKASIK